MHAWLVFRREVLRTPVRTLAAEIGISKSAVDKFYRVRSHPGKNWPKLKDWYMRTRLNTVRDEYQTPPELMVASALALVSQLPNSKRARALRAVAENVRTIHAELKEPQPEWVKMLTDLVEREEPLDAVDKLIRDTVSRARPPA